MIINDPRIYWAQAAALAVTAVGALWTVMGAAGAVGGVVVAIAGFAIMRRAWALRDREPDARAAEAIAAGGLGVAVIVFVIQGLAHALIVLLLGAQLALNAQLREHRQLKFGWMTSFATLMLGAVHATSSHYLLVFCLFALFLLLGAGYTWLDRHSHSGVKAHWPPMAQWRVVVTWLFAAFVLYLLTPRLDALLWGAGGTMSGSGYYDREWDRQARDIGGRAPAALPQSGTGDAATGSGTGGTGTSETNRGRSGTPSREYQGFNERQFDITQPDPEDGRVSNVKVLAMQAPHGAYLRVRTFDRFDGVSWSNTLSGRQIWRGDLGRFRFDGNGRLIPNFNQQMQVLAPLPPAIPGVAPALVVHFPAAALRRTEYGTFEAPRGLQTDTRYTVESRIARNAGRFFDPHSPPPRSQDLDLPEAFDPRIAALADSITAGVASPRERAVALETHLRTGYEYSLSSVFTSQNRTPLSEFLFETRLGHCEYFAAALAVMLRTQDIPTRLSTGYSATTYNPITGRFEVRVLDGHAWVEAWIDDAWMLLEPTPFYPLPQPQEGRLTAEQIETYLARLAAIDEALGKTEDRHLDPERLLLRFWQSVIETANLIIALLAWLLLAAWPLWLLLIVTAAAGIWLWHRHRDALLDWWADQRLQRYRFTRSAADFHYVFALVQERMARRDYARLPGQTLADYCAKLNREGLLSDTHGALQAAAHACFVEARTWQPDWRGLLLAFYADVKYGIARQNTALRTA